MKPRAFAAVLGLLLAPTLPMLAADNPSERPDPATYLRRHTVKPAKSLVLLNTKVDDRRRFETLIDREYLSSYVLCSAVDEDRDRNIVYQLLLGTRADIIREHGFDTLVIVSNFRDATLQYEKLSYEDSVKYWVTRFEEAKKVRPIRLVLLSTDKKPDADLIALAEHTGGSYRKLKPNADGNYE